MAFLRFIVHAIGHLANPTDSFPISNIDVSNDIGQLPGDRFDAFLRMPLGMGSPTEAQGRVHVDPLALPPHVEADSLLHLYFTTVNLMIPCIHEETFRDTHTGNYRQTAFEVFEDPGWGP